MKESSICSIIQREPKFTYYLCRTIRLQMIEFVKVDCSQILLQYIVCTVFIGLIGFIMFPSMVEKIVEGLLERISI